MRDRQCQRQRAETAEKGADGHQQGGAGKQEQHRAEGSAGGKAEQIGVCQRIACHHLHDGAGQRQRRPHAERAQYARQAQVPDDGIAHQRQRVFSNEPEVMEDRRPGIERRNVGGAEHDSGDDADKQQAPEREIGREAGRPRHHGAGKERAWSCRARSMVAGTLRTPASEAGNGMMR